MIEYDIGVEKRKSDNREEYNMKCPKCGKDYEETPAISRVDNKTNICSRCGFIEALEAAGYSEEEMQGQLKAFDDSAGKYYRLS